MSIVQKSQFVSLIVTKDRDFKTRAVNFFNGVAFNAEKISTDDFESSKLQVVGRKEILNVVIDGSTIEVSPEDIFKGCVEIGKKKPGVMILVYFPEESCAKMKFLEKCPGYILFRDFPFDKIHFNDCFHGRGKAAGGSFNSFPGAQQSMNFNSKKIDKKDADEGKKPNIIAFEASSHVRDTIQMLKAIQEDSSNMESFFDFGQKFNGITGAFAYLGNRPGWAEIRQMSIIIDEICKAYTKNSDWKSLQESHLKMIQESAKNVYLILKFLREVKAPEQALLDDCKRIIELRKSMTEIPEVEAQSQDEVDALLSQLSE